MSGSLTVQLANGTNAGAVTAADGTATAKAADYPVTDTDRIRTVLMTTAGSNRTVTLPTAADNVGRVITVKKVDSGTGQCIVDGEGAETIDGFASIYLFKQYEAVTIQCDGTTWHIIDAAWASGTYAPTVTNVLDFTSISGSAALFARVGPVTVKVSGGFVATNADATLHQATITLPISKANFAAGTEGFGTICSVNHTTSAQTSRSAPGVLSSTNAAQTMDLAMHPVATSAVGNYMYEFMYTIK